MTSGEFETEFARLATFYGWEPNETQVEIWWQEFELEPVARVHAGIDVLCRNWRPEYGVRHPHPQDLREALPPIVAERPPERLRSPEEEARGLRLLRAVLDRYEGSIDDEELQRRLKAEGVEAGNA